MYDRIPQMTVYLIAAVSENNVIGMNGNLPWRLPLDLQWFKMNTSGGAIIMGRKTWESLPKKPLPSRLNIIISRQPRKSHGDTIWCTSFSDPFKSSLINPTYLCYWWRSICRLAMRHVHIFY